MGWALKVEINNLGEVTDARIFKGSAREIFFRHASSLIHLLSYDETSTLGRNENTNAIKRSLIHLLSCDETSTLGSNENT